MNSRVTHSAGAYMMVTDPLEGSVWQRRRRPQKVPVKSPRYRERTAVPRLASIPRRQSQQREKI